MRNDILIEIPVRDEGGTGFRGSTFSRDIALSFTYLCQVLTALHPSCFLKILSDRKG